MVPSHTTLTRTRVPTSNPGASDRESNLRPFSPWAGALTTEQTRSGHPPWSLMTLQERSISARQEPRERAPASPFITACCGQLAPRIEFHFLSGHFLLVLRALAFVRVTRVCGVERIQWQLIDLTSGSPQCGGRTTDKPCSWKPNQQSCHTCKCQAESQNPRLRLSGFVLLFPAWDVSYPFLNRLCDVRTENGAGLATPSPSS